MFTNSLFKSCSGVVRDFAGPYFVSEDNMAFGKPAKYWRLDPARWFHLEIKYDENICLFRAEGGASGWDSAVSEASEIYGKN